MGLSHLAIVRAHPELDLVAGCDATAYLTDILSKHAGLKCYADFDDMLDAEPLDALVVATPSKLHAPMVEKALDARPARLLREAVRARRRRRRAARRAGAKQVAASRRSATTIASSARSRRRRGSSSRARSARSTTCAPRPTGRSCCAGRAAPGARPRTKAAARSTTTPATRSTSSTSSSARRSAVGGVVRHSVFSRDVDDEVYSTLHFAERRERPAVRELERRELSQDVDQDHASGARTAALTADRQECQLYLREPHAALPGVDSGLDGALHDRPHRRGLVLPARRGVLGADRLLRAEHRRRAGSTARTPSPPRSRPTGSSRCCSATAGDARPAARCRRAALRKGLWSRIVG